MVTLSIDGARVVDIASFYDEINRVFMAGEDWQLGPSLDALDDLLYGGFGALAGTDMATVVWAGSETSRRALGREATRAHYLAKLAQPDIFNAAYFAQQLAELDRGEGPTYFEIVLEIFADHPNINLRLD